MAEFFTHGQIIESDVDMVDQILSAMQSDIYLNRAIDQFTPQDASYEIIREYNLGAAICFSYLTSLPFQYGQRQLRHLLEHAQARNQLLAGATTLGLNETATNHLLVS